MAVSPRSLIYAAALILLPSAAAENISDTRSELNAVQSRLQTEKTLLRESEAGAAAAEAELKTIETGIGKNTAKLHRLQRDKQVAQLKLIELRRENRLLEQRKSDHELLLAKEVTAQYLRRGDDTLRVWLGDSKPSQIGNLLVYHRYVSAARQDHLARTKQSLSELEAGRRLINAKKDELAELERQQRTQLQELEKKRSERALLLASLNETATRSRGTIARLESDSQRLSELLERLQRKTARRAPETAVSSAPIILPRSQSFAKRKGLLPWPVNGKLVSNAGGRDRTAGTGYRGIIIDAESGAFVRAIAPGRVVFAEWLRGFGLLLILDHGDGYFSLYGHNEALLREVGDHVDESQEIATVGSSGGLTSSGLYFEIRHKGKPVDPILWCNNRG